MGKPWCTLAAFPGGSAPTNADSDVLLPVQKLSNGRSVMTAAALKIPQELTGGALGIQGYPSMAYPIDFGGSAVYFDFTAALRQAP